MRTVFVDPLIDGRQGLPQSRDSMVDQASGEQAREDRTPPLGRC